MCFGLLTKDLHLLFTDLLILDLHIFNKIVKCIKNEEVTKKNEWNRQMNTYIA